VEDEDYYDYLRISLRRRSQRAQSEESEGKGRAWRTG